MSKKQDTDVEPERVVIRDNRKIDRDAATGAQQAGEQPPPQPAASVDTEPGVDAALVEERTRDLQRLQAEYANYRKRAERERLAAGDLATGRVLAELLPIVDDLDRAKAHGDLTGALKAVSDKLDSVFGKLGMVAFGQAGDPFDPEIHEAVMHAEDDSVSEPTATTVMRAGYKHGDRLLRPAMVGVTAPLPGSSAAPAADPDTVGVDDLSDATAGLGADEPSAAD